MLDIIRLFKEKKIPYSEEGSKHNRKDWVQTICPFCANKSKMFLGYSLISGAWNCWHCGKHKTADIFKKILPREDLDEIYAKYFIKVNNQQKRHKKEYERDILVKLPLGCKQIEKRHIEYLKRRNFCPEKLVETWGLLGTGTVGDYRNRIIAPIYLDDILISYQGRDITGKSELKYKACAKENEARDHKTSLYGIDLVVGNAAIIVEGIADAWRLGAGAIATFGTAFTPPQVNLFCKRFKKGYLLFDPEDDAQRRAESIAAQIDARGVPCEILCYSKSDPGDMPQELADEIMQELIF